MFSLATKTGGGTAGSSNDPYFNYVTLLLHGDGTNGAQNGTFLDSSTNNLTITNTSNCTQGNFTPFNYNYSMNCLGSASQYVALPTALNAQYGALASSTYGLKTTIEFWVFNTAIQNTSSFIGGIFGNLTSGAVNGRYSIKLVGTSVTSTQTVRFTWSLSTTTTTFVTTTAALTQNTWNHVAVTIDATTPASTTIVIYINGVGQTFSGNNLSTHTTDPTLAFRVANDNSTDQTFTGYISNFRFSRGSSLIYTTDFSSSLPTQKFLPTTSTKALLFQNPYFRDESPYNATLTVNTSSATPQVVVFNPYLNYTQPTPTSYSGFFDGTGDYITFPNTAALQMSTGDFTWEGWIFINKTSTLMGVMGLGTATTGLEISVTAANNIRASYTATNLTGTTALAANTWYHVALVRIGSSTGNVKIYLNGALEATSGTAVTDNFNQTNSQVVGDVRATGTPFNGLISNVRIVKGVGVYTGAFTVPTAPLASTQSSGTNIAAITGTQTSLLTCQSSTFADNSTFAYLATSNGQAQPMQYNPFGFVTSTSLQPYSATVTGGAMFFDNTAQYLSIASNAAFALGTGDFTYEAWGYIFGTDGLNIYDSRVTSTGNGINMSISGSPPIPVYRPQGTNQITGSAVSYTSWFHIAYVRYSGVTKMYVNGLQSGSSYTDSQNIAQAAIKIATNFNASSTSNGYICNARLIKGTAYYLTPFVPPTAPLTAVTNTQMLLLGANYASPDNAIRNAFQTVGNAQINTSVYKYSTGSWLFDGTGDFLKQPISYPDTTFGAGDFTIEFWVYPAATPAATRDLIAKGHQSTGNVYGSYLVTINTSNVVAFSASSTGASYDVINNKTIGTAPNTTWTAIAITRSGSDFRAYINGSLASGWPATSTATLFNATNVNLVIGADSIAGANFNGYMDEIRFTKGVARYTGSSYTLQTSAFPDQ